MDRLQRASELIATIERCEAELRQIFGSGAGASARSAAPTSNEQQPVIDRRKGTRSPEARARMAASQKARWAKQKGSATTTEEAPGKPAKGKKKRTMSPEARAKIAAAQKKRWAKQKSGK